MIHPEAIEKVINVIGSRLRPEGELTIGTEIENIIYDHNLRRIPVNRDGQLSSIDIKDRLDTLSEKTGISPTLSVEPGGQLEFGSSPFLSLHELNREWQIYLGNLLQICAEENLILLDFSMDPLYAPEEITLINLKKYHLMHDLFASTGKCGHWMMKSSTSVQTNFDYLSLEDAAWHAYLADCLQPFLALIFANSPFQLGKPTGTKNLRLETWQDTDPDRCGGLLDHGIDTPDHLLEQFAHVALHAPAIYTVTKWGDVAAFEGKLGEWLSSLLRTGELHSSDVLTALHQIFTHVRFKDVLEVRTPDRPLFGYEMAPVAFLTGLLRSPQIPDKLMEQVSTWTAKKRGEVIEKSRILDLSQDAFDGKTFKVWIEYLFQLALEGLDRRSELLDTPSERIFLEPFAESFLSRGPFSLQIQDSFRASGQTLAEFLKERWFREREKLQRNRI